MIAAEPFGAVGDPRYKDYAGDIHTSGKHLLQIINDVLDIAKIESGKTEIQALVCDVEDFLHEAVNLATGQFPTAWMTSGWTSRSRRGGPIATRA